MKKAIFKAITGEANMLLFICGMMVMWIWCTKVEAGADGIMKGILQRKV